MVTEELLRSCHNKKMRIIAWTVINIEEIKKMMDLGVDDIIADFPGIAVALRRK